VWSDIAEGKLDCRRMSLKDDIEKFGTFGHAPSNKAHADASIACGIHLACEPSFITVTAANNTKPTRLTYRCGQSPIGDDVHRGK